MRNRNNKTRVLYILLILLLLMSVGFAALNSVINVNISSSIDGSLWKVYIKSIEVSKKSNTANGIIPEHFEETEITNLETILNRRGDYVEYTVIIENAGDFDTYLTYFYKNINFECYGGTDEENNNVCKYITLEVYDENNDTYPNILNNKLNENLPKHTQKTIKLRVDYDKNNQILASELVNKPITVRGLDIKFVYELGTTSTNQENLINTLKTTPINKYIILSSALNEKIEDIKIYGNSNQKVITTQNMFNKNNLEIGPISHTTGQNIITEYTDPVYVNANCTNRQTTGECGNYLLSDAWDGWDTYYFNSARSINYISALPNTTYTLSSSSVKFSMKLIEYDENKNFIKTNQVTTGPWTTNLLTITTTNETRYLKISIIFDYNNNNIIDDNYITIGLFQLEKNNTRSEYIDPEIAQTMPSPEAKSNISVVNNSKIITSGKNLFDPNLLSYSDAFQINDDEITILHTDMHSWDQIRDNKNYKYFEKGTYTVTILGVDECTFQISDPVETHSLYIYNPNKSTHFTFTIDKDRYLGFKIYDDEATYPIKVKVQIEKSTYESKYEKYYEDEYNLDIQNDLVGIDNIRDYISYENNNWYLNKKIEKIILNGTENYNLIENNNSPLGKYIEFNINKNTNNNIESENRIISDSFMTITDDISNLSHGTISIANNKIRIGMNVNDINEFKTYLQNSNVIIYYVLENSEKQLIQDQTLINQLNNLKNIKLNTIRTYFYTKTVNSQNTEALLEITYKG